MKHEISEQDIIQNLIDAGCDDQTIAHFIECLHQGNEKEKQCTLEEHRKCILEKLHKSQREIDCLDYLIYQLKK